MVGLVCRRYKVIEKPKIFAHRGLSSQAPENTMAAFEKALNYNINGIEFDVQMTKDRKLVVIHDERLERTTNGSGYVKDYNYKELLALDAGSWFSTVYSGEKIPLLEDVLELLKNYDLLINIELKNSFIEYEGIEEEVIKLVNSAKVSERVIISSFNHYSLKRIRELESNINIAVLCQAIMYEPIEYLKSVGANALHTSIYTVNKKLIDCLNKNKIEVRCYTVNDELNYKRLCEFGVSGVFTDIPDYLIKLREGG